MNLKQLYKLVKTKNMKEKEAILNDQIGGTLNTKDASELVKVVEIEGTPFALVYANEKVFLAMGHCQISEMLDEEEAYLIEARVRNRDWDIILNVAYAVAGEILKGKISIPNEEPIVKVYGGDDPLLDE
ncbi:MAG: hypothetical protein [Microviridae sp.]|nr:MAG: hypothetical protein [Microviridae sp.]